MKKKILSIMFVIVTIIIAGYTVNQNINKKQISDLALANIEALAKGENNNNGYIELPAICSHCKQEKIACLWCQEDPNYCNCNPSPHICK